MIADAYNPRPGRFDDEARAELLCYLVLGQLVARARTGAWLRTDHLIESTRIWLAGNGADADWMERVQLGALSERIALDFAELPRFADPASLAKLFTDGWRLDYRSPIVRGVYAACKSELNPYQP
ncbi:hypothetical protein M0D68_06945 [Paraburkholderia sp. SEWSISQ10-3 4]|uniref:hypothetical protein n=1 Tax=Paraburkholderia TaxID=1822464 RepID=UPI002259805A|nr:MULTISPECIES: hypothetical protein [Paraburkholderia]MCX4137914.1 hypothetical protein [Paraburkholderia aspalathi]MDN7170605.1 hypothetical protein [Paraburkholderia sp. SEWSISQ10-3 4]MDQ6500244.1 hypothetical protein [Paraburkholderia aspalathi]